MTKNYTDDELEKIEEAADKLPEHVKREIFKTPPKIDLPKMKKVIAEKKKAEESSDSAFLVPPPV